VLQQDQRDATLGTKSAMPEAHPSSFNEHRWSNRMILEPWHDSAPSGGTMLVTGGLTKRWSLGNLEAALQRR
jgi:hypothetical protein